MKGFDWKRLLPHILAIAIFFIVSIFYCLPATKGMMVNMHDVLGWKGMAQQSFEFKEKYGHMPFWTNSMFGGMPVYQIAYEPSGLFSLSYFGYLFTLDLPQPISIFFLACVSFYFLCISLKLKPWVAILAALGYAFATYSAVIVGVGHTSKFYSMAYAPAVIAGIILLIDKKYILGFITTLLFSTLMVWQNHLQIVYYTFIICFCLAIAFVIHVLKTKDFKHLIITAILALLAGAYSLASYSLMLLPLNEYAKETMRGGRSELTPIGQKSTENKTVGGLDKDYAFGWSYGIDEIGTFILPSFKGGSSGGRELGEGGKAVQAMQDAGLPQDAVNYFSQYLSAYWGSQPSTSGPVYFGAIICLFFIAGIVLVKDWNKGWILAATVVGIMLAWGSNFPAVNYFLFDHLPLYNKFRAPSMSLVIPQLTFPLLAALALQTLFYGNISLVTHAKQLRLAAIAVGAVLVLVILVYVTASFKSKNDANLKDGIASALTQAMTQQSNGKEQAVTTASAVMSGLSADRKGLFGSDLIKLLFFTALSGGIVWLVVNKKVKPEVALVLLTAALFYDLITIDLKYLNAESYIDKEEFIAPLAANRADLQIKKDTGFFRVFDQMTDNYSDSRCAYHHNSIGGYHPAKLALYQDIIERQLGKGNMNVFNMLNTKYFITQNPADKQPIAQENPSAFGNVWLVKSLKYVQNADEDMKALDSISKDFAVLDVREKTKVTVEPQPDTAAKIQFINNKNDYAKYNFEANTNQFAVFSEIYYPYGWIAKIDGKEVPIARVNYVLRGVSIPAGKHLVEMEFKPESVAKGEKISMILGLLGYTVLLGGCFLLWRNNRKIA